MNRTRLLLLIAFIALATLGYFVFSQTKGKVDERFVSYIVDLNKQDLQLYWKNDSSEIFKSIGNLRFWLNTKNKNLIFAMNSGMFKKDNSPQGLFIDNGKTIVPIDTANGNGNFYLMPNGVFYITTDNVPKICKTPEYNETEKTKYATQSGPMLVIDGQIHSAFKDSSINLNIRNGVGILPNNNVVFAMSKAEINFYDFANFFKNLGCKNALYLDGFVSRTYLPEKKWIQTEGNLGVIIGVTEKKNK